MARKGLERMQGKRVELIFQDSEVQATKRVGTLLDWDDNYIILSYEDETTETLPNRRIIRIKELGGKSR